MIVGGIWNLLLRAEKNIATCKLMRYVDILACIAHIDRRVQCTRHHKDREMSLLGLRNICHCCHKGLVDKDQDLMKGRHSTQPHH